MALQTAPAADQDLYSVEEFFALIADGQKADVLGDGQFFLVPLENNRIFRSEALPGFWLDVEWLIAHPLPSSVDCLSRILAGEPS